MTERRALIDVERLGPVLRVSLNNPPANALSLELMEGLQAELDTARADAAVHVVVVAAAGKLFSAGHDLKQMTSHRSDDDHGEAYFRHVFATCSRLMQSIVASPMPVIAEVDGVAAAAGCQLVASCDLAFASDRSRFAVNGIDVGLFCTTPAVALTRVVSSKRAMEMLLTGEMIDATNATDIGLVNRVYPADALRAAVNDCAALIAAKPPAIVKLGKAAIAKQGGLDLAGAYEVASRTMVENMLTAEAAEGIAAFLEKGKPKKDAPQDLPDSALNRGD